MLWHNWHYSCELNSGTLSSSKPFVLNLLHFYVHLLFSSCVSLLCFHSVRGLLVLLHALYLCVCIYGGTSLETLWFLHRTFVLSSSSSLLSTLESISTCRTRQVLVTLCTMHVASRIVQFIDSMQWKKAVTADVCWPFQAWARTLDVSLEMICLQGRCCVIWCHNLFI